MFWHGNCSLLATDLAPPPPFTVFQCQKHYLKYELLVIWASFFVILAAVSKCWGQVGHYWALEGRGLLEGHHGATFCKNLWPPCPRDGPTCTLLKRMSGQPTTSVYLFVTKWDELCAFFVTKMFFSFVQRAQFYNVCHTVCIETGFLRFHRSALRFCHFYYVCISFLWKTLDLIREKTNYLLRKRQKRE